MKSDNSWPVESDFSLAQSSTVRIFRPNFSCRKFLEFVNEKMSEDFFTTLAQHRSEGNLCDITLETEPGISSETGSQVKAHKIVLASSSPYFAAMFSSPMIESTMDKVTLKDIDGAALSDIIDYMYSGKIKIDENKVQNILTAASILQLQCVRDACAKYLHDQLDASNCIGIHAFAVSHSCCQVANAALAYMERHFEEVTQFDEMLSLDVESFVELISDDKLSVIGEETVFRGIKKWIEYDPENREKFMPRLLSNVRLPLLSKDIFFNEVNEDPVVKANMECKNILLEACRYTMLSQLKMEDVSWTQPRRPFVKSELIMLIGGQAPKASSTVDVYDPRLSIWTQSAPLPQRRCRTGTAVVGDDVYVIGGFNGTARIRSVDVYDRNRDCWTHGPSMDSRRSTLGVTALDGNIYAVGGFDGSMGLATAEMLDPRVGQWMAIAPMATRRSSVALTAGNGLLYAVGGYDGLARSCVNTVECFDKRADRWYIGPPLNQVRSGAGVTFFNGHVVVIGGHDGPGVRQTAEILTGDLWSMLPDMNIKRRNAGIITANDLLFAIGGDDGQNNLDSIEVLSYNKDNDNYEWNVLVDTLPTARSYAGVAALSKADL